MPSEPAQLLNYPNKMAYWAEQWLSWLSSILKVCVQLKTMNGQTADFAGHIVALAAHWQPQPDAPKQAKEAVGTLSM